MNKKNQSEIRNQFSKLECIKWRKLGIKEPMGMQLNRNELARILQDNHSSCKILQDNRLL